MKNFLNRFFLNHKRILLNDTGNLAAVMMVSITVAGSLYYLGNNVNRTAKSGSDSIKREKERNFLMSGITFVKYNIVNRKCIDLETGTDKESCKINDPGNLERLVLSPLTINDMIARFSTASGVDKNLRLDSLKFTIDKSAVTDLHPLATTFSNGIKSIDYDIASSYDSSKGDYFELRIHAVINFIKDTDGKIEATEKIVVAPFRVNQYTLSLNKDLYIGKEKDGANSLVSEGKEGLGLKFYSPIFVNGDLVIPASANDKAKGIDFMSAPFVGKSFKTNLNTPVIFTPQVEGDLLLENLVSYQGLKKGVEYTSYSKGLAQIFSSNPDSFSTDLMVQCIAHAKTKYNVKASQGSRFIMKKESDTSFLFGLTRLNEFRTIRKKVTEYNESLMDKYFVDHEKPKKSVVIKLEDVSGEIPKFEMKYKTNYTIKGTIANGLAVQLYDDAGKLKVLLDQSLLDEADHVMKVSEAIDANGKYSDCENTASNISVDCAAEITKKASTITARDEALVVKEASKLLSDTSRDKSKLCEASGTPTLSLKALKVENSKGERVPSIVRIKSEYFSGGLDCYEFKKIRFKMTGYNFLSSRFSSEDRGDNGPNTSDREIEFRFNSTTQTFSVRYSGGEEISESWTSLAGSNVHLSPDEIKTLSTDGVNLDVACSEFEANSTTHITTNKLDMDYDLSDKSAFLSWNFNPISKKFQIDPSRISTWSSLDNGKDVPNQITINDSNDVFFHVYSVLDRCVVESDAKYLIGFLSCRRLIIRPRTEPLEIIGSFIVDKMMIDPSAITAGISWRNIFNARSAKILADSKILTGDCNSYADRPLWHPFAAPGEMKRANECSTNYMASVVDPFNWSSFSPECGVTNANELVTKCKPKKRNMKFKITSLGYTFKIKR